MKRQFKTALMITLLAFVFGLPPLVSLQIQAEGLCCVAGKYEGFKINYVKPNCPRPLKETFTMFIKQMRPCSAAVGGTITDPAGELNHWTGTLSPGLARGCCLIEGNFLTSSGNTVKFKGTICLKSGKWHAQGTWEEIKSPDPCRGGGTWQMSRI